MRRRTWWIAGHFGSAAAALALFLTADSAFAAVRTSVRSGRWSEPLTWAQGMIPGPGDEAVIAPGHQVVFTDADDAADECARLTISAGGALGFGGEATVFGVGGDGPGVAGGILIAGSMTIPGGVTVTIDPDGNADSEEDGVTVQAGGSLTLLGSLLYEGTVGSVISDDNAADILFTDPGLPVPVDAARARVVWRSGLRKGRWYEIASLAGSTLALDFDSRSNAARLGEPDYSAGSASVSGRVVTGTGTTWTDPLADGSWWWCASDGESARVRIRRVDSATSLQLAEPYPGVGCITPGPYTIRDENQPYPAVDVSERIRPGDTYRIILPAGIRSAHGSDMTFDEQTFVRVQDGGIYHFQNASFESVGKALWALGEGSGVRIAGFDGRTDPGGIFDTVEVYRYGGEAGMEWEDSSHFDVDWLFVHWAHPLITTSNEAHGLKLEHNAPSFSFDDVRVRNARFDRTNDDFVWWSTRVGGISGVYDSIGKYCPNTASGHSGDAIDTDDELGATGGQLRIERNLFANLGTAHGGSCMSAAARSAGGQAAWTGQGWVARDNVCLNIQDPCMFTIGGSRTWDREQIWAVNNVCAAVSSGGIDLPHVYQNEVLDYHLSRLSGISGLANVYQAKGNIVRSIDKEPGDTFVGQVASVGQSLTTQANWMDTTWTLSDNILVASVTGLVAYEWSSPAYPSRGQALVTHNVFVGNPLNDPTLNNVAFYDGHSEPTTYHVTFTDNIIEMLNGNSSAGAGANQAVNDRIDRNVVRVATSPQAWLGNLIATNDYPVTTGIDPLRDDFELKPDSGAWTVATTDGDKPGPRFAGTLSARLPFQVPGLVPIVDPEGDDRDSDGDALIDRWDNCPARANPGWPDSDGDGRGDACDPCPTPPGASLPDFDGDGLEDACEIGPLLSDANNSGVVDGYDLALLARAFGSETGQPAYDPRVDLDRNGLVDGDDLVLLAPFYGQTLPFP